VRGHSRFGTTASAYIKRYDSPQDEMGHWHLLRSWPVSQTEMTHNISLPPRINDYIRNGRIEIVVRGVLPMRFGNQPFTYAFNTAVLDTRTSGRDR
jgi:hypothetical protein